MLDAIVVLGCAAGPDGRPRSALQRRVERAAHVYREGRAAILVVSGGKRWHGAAEADVMRVALRAIGVPEQAIVAERRSLSTLENALYSSKLLEARSLRQVGVVTCDWHMRRALDCFRLMGVDAVPLPAPSPPVSRSRAVLRAWRERAHWALAQRFAIRGRLA